MKIIIFIFILSYTISITTYDLEIINLGEYDTKKTNLTDAGICLNIKKIDNNDKFYLVLSSKNGSINEIIQYEFLNDTCYTNYTYDPDDCPLKPKKRSSTTSYKEEFSYEYEFKKEEQFNYVFVIYTNFTGYELSISFSKLKSKTILFIFLGIFGGFIILLIIICFCCYKCCKKRQKSIEDDFQNFETNKLVN